jgi:MoaA/NifB/PqqE/SkfB family radical SAM enzyme
MESLAVTILPTRKCNLRCSYCKIKNQNFPNELSWSDWVIILKKINEQFSNICFTVLLGGDITTWGEDLVKFVAAMSNTEISYAFTTNGLLLTETYLKKLKKYGLNSISLSLDTLKIRKDKHENIKSQTTVKLLPLLNTLGFEELHCTVTVDNTNLEEIPEIIEFLTNQKTYSEITPMLYGKNSSYDYTSDYKTLKNRLFTVEDVGKINEVMQKVIEMKKEGYLVHNTNDYLLNWSKWGIKQNWKCGYPVNLVADADGSMRLCLQIKGNSVTKHHIGSLDFGAFLKDWYKDYNEFCQGCYWNCSAESKFIYEKTGSIEAVKQYFNHAVMEIDL